MVEAMPELTIADEEEANERQLAELEFIKSAYDNEEARVVNIATKNERRSVVRFLNLPLHHTQTSSKNSQNTVLIELKLEMPPEYPLIKGSSLIIKGLLRSYPVNPTYIRKAALTAIPRLLQECQSAAVEFSRENDGGETVWHVLNHADEWIESQWLHMLHQNKHEKKLAETLNTFTQVLPVTLGRRSIYSHHIIANSKRKALSSLALENDLGGYVKIGWPGVIIIEGLESSCRLFVEEIKSWRWQHLSVRVEETKDIVSEDELDSNRKLPKKFIELGEDEMSTLARYCKEAGLEHMFLTCLKIFDDKKTLTESTISLESTSDQCDDSHQRGSYGALVQVDHMNDRKRYLKSLDKMCKSTGCVFFIRYCPTPAQSRYSPKILIALIGDEGGVKNLFKQWRTSHVDVDSRSKPCLERMMIVLKEGPLDSATNGMTDCIHHGSSFECVFNELNETLIGVFGTHWLEDINFHHNSF